jgi:glycine cleavage system regulatory protein
VTSPIATSLVLTLLGPDRPGLVERLSQVLADHQGNWVESRMAHLAGQFAGILRVELPESRVADFESTCSSLAREGLQVLVAGSRTVADGSTTRVLKLELVGHDRPGIVREISQALTKNGINVEELNTGVESAPMSAEMLFFAKARLAVPIELTSEQLLKILEPIGSDLMVDISLSPNDR